MVTKVVRDYLGVTFKSVHNVGAFEGLARRYFFYIQHLQRNKYPFKNYDELNKYFGTIESCLTIS